VKSLTASLLAAQRSASALPYVRAVLADYDGYAQRGRFTRHYDGVEAANFHAAVIASDGALVRLRVDGANLLVSRVANPTPGSDFSSWTNIATNVAAGTGIAMVRRTGSEIRVFWVVTGGVTINQRSSTDDGATWLTPGGIIVTGGAKTHLAAAASDGSGGSNGDILLVWSEGAGLFRSRYNGGAGTWGARTAATPTFASLRGVAVTYVMDWQVVVTGTELTTTHPRVWAVRYGDGVNQASNTWGSLREVTGSYAGSNVEFTLPAVGYTQECFRLFFVERYLGSVAYDRLQWTTLALSHDFNEEQWREPVAFDYTSLWGVSVAAAAERLWLVATDGVWSSPLPAIAELDVSGQVLEATVEVTASGGRVELELEASLWGEALLSRGARLQLTPGYRTSADEVPLPYTYWVESVELVTGARSRVVVKARDGWALLERWRARRQFVWLLGDKTVSQLLLFLTARAGAEYSTVGTSAPLTTLRPAFTVHAGESGVTAARRLLAMVEDAPRWAGAGRLETVLTADDDVATYEFGVTHSVLEARYVDGAPEVNRVRVLGLGVYGEAFDFADAEASGERIAQVIDVNLDAGGEAADRAAAVLRRARLAVELGELRLFGVHCGVELWDVVELTDAQAFEAAEAFRVSGYGWRFEPARGRYDMQLTLGPV
jgi:hypothetical protein